jgi:transketolase
VNSEDLAKRMRRTVLKMTSAAGASHVGSCLSVLDIVAVLYSDEFGITLENWKSRDSNRVILSKGHAVAAVYAALAEGNFIQHDELNTFCRDGSKLGGHPSHFVPGIELSTGSLGHGLPFGAGLALGKKRKKYAGRVYVIMSDGELDEGTTWETALFAQHNNLDNLTVVIDRNRLQSLESTETTLSLEPLDKKFQAFNWNVVTIDGHNHMQLRTSLRIESGRPNLIIAETTKGKGVSFMENSVKWHYKSPNAEEVKRAIVDFESLGL